MEPSFNEMLTEIVGEDKALEIRRLVHTPEGAAAISKWMRSLWITSRTDVFIEVSYPEETNSSYGPASFPYFKAIDKLPEGRVLGERHQPFGFRRAFGKTFRAYIFGSMPD